MGIIGFDISVFVPRQTSKGTLNLAIFGGRSTSGKSTRLEDVPNLINN